MNSQATPVQMPGRQSTRTPQQRGDSNRDCICTLPWCDSHFKGRMFKKRDLPSLGSVGIRGVPDEHADELRHWLKSVLCTNVRGHMIDDWVENRADKYKEKRIGRWHFTEAMLKPVKGGHLGLDWESKPLPGIFSRSACYSTHTTTNIW